jgi:hypothetical protein
MTQKRKPVFYTAKKTAKVKDIWAVKPKPLAPKAQIGTIQGRTPGSILEWNVSQALDALGWGYDYQHSLAGGWEHLPGSQVLDFLVYTPGLPTPLNVNGRYWHTGIHADPLDFMQIKKLMYGKCQIPVVIWEENCQTIADATAWLRQHLGIG